MAVIEDMSTHSPTAMEREIAAKKKALDKRVEKFAKLNMKLRSDKIQILKSELEIIEMRIQLLQNRLAANSQCEDAGVLERPVAPTAGAGGASVPEGQGNSLDLQAALDAAIAEKTTKEGELEAMENN